MNSKNHCANKQAGNFYHKGWGIYLLMVFLVFVSLLASAIKIKPVNAAGNLITSTVSTINPNSGLQYGIKAAGKDIIFQQSCSNDIYEPDNDYLLAAIISTDGIPQPHVNTPPTDEDWVKFNAIAGHQYEIRTQLTNDINQSDTAANDTLLYLYRPDGSTLVTWNDDVGYTTWYNGYYYYRESIISWTALLSGIYYVRELQWGPTAGYIVRDCHTYNMWVEDLTILTLVKSITSGNPYSTVGGAITYSYAVLNSGKVLLAGPVSVTDDQATVTCPNMNTVGNLDANLDPGESLTCTASHTVTQTDLNAGSVTNHATAHAAGIDSNQSQATANATQNPALTLVKSITSGDPYNSVGGTIAYSYGVTNSGNISLAGPVSVSDDQATVTCPNVNTVGNLDASLDPGESLTCTASHTVTQTDLNAGSVTNHATAHAAGIDSNQYSQTANAMLKPPFGIKTVDASGLPELSWTMVWINGSNIVAVNAAVSDPVPVGTAYIAGSLSCSGASAQTTTTNCAYEIPSIPYPRGRVVWTGTIGPDLGAINAGTANNELTITFNVKVNSGVNSVENNATMDADLTRDGDMTDPSEQNVATASASWTNPPIPSVIIPNTGFAPDRVTVLPSQTTSYTEIGDLWLEIPRLSVRMTIMGVPQINGKWDVSWLGNDAGWLNGSAYPTWKGNSVLTGHVTDASGNPGPFARLNTLMWGDKVIVHASGAQYIYEVRSVLQSGPGSSSAMMKHEVSSWVTLVTCRGYDASSNSYLYRILVRAVLIEVK